MAILGILAKSSKPGDRLYTYRLRVREPVIGAFYVTAERHGEYELTLLESRIKEMISLLQLKASEQTISSAVNSFRVRENKVVSRIHNYADSGKVEVADNLYAIFRAQISAYRIILEGLESGRTEARESLEQSLTDAVGIDEKLTSTFLSRYKVQDLIKLFDDHLRAAQHLVTEVEGQVSISGPYLSADYRKAIEQRLERSKSLLSDALTKHGNDLDREAYREVNRAVALLKELQIYLTSVNVYPEPRLPAEFE